MGWAALAERQWRSEAGADQQEGLGETVERRVQRREVTPATTRAPMSPVETWMA